MQKSFWVERNTAEVVLIQILHASIFSVQVAGGALWLKLHWTVFKKGHLQGFFSCSFFMHELAECIT